MVQVELSCPIFHSEKRVVGEGGGIKKLKLKSPGAHDEPCLARHERRRKKPALTRSRGRSPRVQLLLGLLGFYEWIKDAPYAKSCHIFLLWSLSSWWHMLNDGSHVNRYIMSSWHVYSPTMMSPSSTCISEWDLNDWNTWGFPTTVFMYVAIFSIFVIHR